MEMGITMDGAEANTSADDSSNILEVACALRDMLNDLIRGRGEAPGMRKVLEFAAQHLVFPEEGLAASRKNQLSLVTTETRDRSISDATLAGEVQISAYSEDSQSEEVSVACMEHARWSALSKEIVQLVVETLPLPELITRRGFSLEWKWDIDFSDCEFRRACDTNHPVSFALVVPENDLGTHTVMIPDVMEEVWQTFRIRIGFKTYNTMTAADGGLVCFVSTFKSRINHSSLILVVNPLTQACRELPQPQGCTGQPKMVQLVTNRETKSYKVILVGYKNASDGRSPAQIFDSQTGTWMNIENSSDRFYGLQYRWNTSNESIIHVGSIVGPCVYDCATARLLKWNDDINPCQGASVEDYALVKDHLLVLRIRARDPEREFDFDPRAYHGWNVDDEDSGVYEISEYKCQKDGLSWKKLQDLPFCEANFDFAYERHHLVRLFACRDYLLIVQKKSVYQYDFSARFIDRSGWVELPDLPDVRLGLGSSSAMMCEVQWDAVP